MKIDTVNRKMEKDAVYRFAAISNPGTWVFMDKMEDMIRIYDYTERISIDDERIYLVSEKMA